MAVERHPPGMAVTHHHGVLDGDGGGDGHGGGPTNVTSRPVDQFPRGGPGVTGVAETTGAEEPSSADMLFQVSQSMVQS